MNLYMRYSGYVLYVLYACLHTQLASPAEYGMTIILERLCISPTEAIRQGDKPYMQQKTLKKPIQNLTDHPELPTFDPLQPIGPPHKEWNQLPILFSELDAITPIQIFNLFFTNSIMGQLVANTTSYAQQQLLGSEKEWQRSWQPVTAQELYLWLAIQIHMGFIGVPPERYWMKDGLPPAAYLGKTRFQEICRFFHVSPYNSPTETPESMPCWLSSIAS